MAFVGEAEDGNRIDFGDARRLKPTRPGRMVRVGVSPFEVDQRNSAQLFRRTKTETGIDNRCKLVGDQWGSRQARIGPAPIPDCDEIGRASCRERGCQYVYNSVGARSLQKTTDQKELDDHEQR